MSVLVLGTRVYNVVATTLCSLNNVRMQEFENPLCVHTILGHNGLNTPQQICRFVALLEAYNRDTYTACDTYTEKGNMLDSPETDELQATTQQFVDAYNGFGQKRTGIVQLYKWLQCITYNIDLEGWGARYEADQDQERYNKYLQIVNHLEHSIAVHIVASLPEYDNAKWGE